MTDPIQALGRVVADEQDALLDERSDELRRVRADVLARVDRPTSRSRRGLVAFGAVALAAATAVSLVVFRGGDPEAPVSYRIGRSGEAAEPGRWLSAGSEPIALAFSDGSEVELAPDSDARVQSLDPNGASLELTRGAASFDVRHRERTSWRIEAGPFVVHVIGTVFDVSWDPNEAAFVMTTHEGRVRVTGPLVDGREVPAGESVAVWVREGRMEARTGENTSTEPEPASVEDERPVPELEVDEPVRGESGTRATEARSEPERAPAEPSAPSFDELAREGRYADAVSAAEAAGWSRTLAEAPPDALLRLADAARLAGRADRAREGYAAVRRRFAGTGAAAQAAFALGRIAFDGAPADSARWLSTYLNEAPNGPLAREAAGRLIEAYQRLGRTGDARRAATSYLERHPDGPHAPLARTLVE